MGDQYSQQRLLVSWGCRWLQCLRACGDLGCGILLLRIHEAQVRWGRGRWIAVPRLGAATYRQGRAHRVAIDGAEGCSWPERIVQKHFEAGARDSTTDMRSGLLKGYVLLVEDFAEERPLLEQLPDHCCRTIGTCGKRDS